MQRWAVSSRGMTFCQVTDDDAMPWISTTIGPEPESPATWSTGGLRNQLFHMPLRLSTRYRQTTES